MRSSPDVIENAITPLSSEIKRLINQSRLKVAVTFHSAIILLYWQIGKLINAEVLQNQRAEYGKEVLATLYRQLVMEYGKGWGEKQLRQCLLFAITFSGNEIVYIVCKQLTWSHICLVMFMKDPLKRIFYIEMCKLGKWRVCTFQDRISSMLYERTTISKKPGKTIEIEIISLKTDQNLSTDLVFRDPYFLDSLGIKETFSEKDLESTIMVEIQKIIIELDSGFAFLTRQMRITIDNDDHYLDLLFYHLRLKFLATMWLKPGKFEAAFKSQMELYLQRLEKLESPDNENPPVGLILCPSKNEEHIEMLRLENSNIKITECLNQLPDLTFLKQKPHQAIEMARSKTFAND